MVHEPDGQPVGKLAIAFVGGGRRARARSRTARRVWLALVALWAATGAWHAAKPMPEGLSFEGKYRGAREVRFWRDATRPGENGEPRAEQQTFDRVLELVGGAERILVLDMFLFNDHLGAATNAYRNLSGELAEAIERRMRERPGLECWFITDPINGVYGGQPSPALDRLKRSGAKVVETRLDRLRDSNPAYSAVWRLALRHWPRAWGPRLPNPFGGGTVPLASYFELMNFKANHRKTVVADRGGKLVGLATSANPHDGSSLHHNVGIEFEGAAAEDLLATEAAACAASGAAVPRNPFPPEKDEGGAVRLRVLTEGAIGRACLEVIDGAKAGDEVEIATFYLSSRAIVEALKRAQGRGARARALLDPNRDAFGREKNGIPNRPVAAELAAAGIGVEWADTHGEQYHAKLLWRKDAAGEATAIVGSANHTRRNLNDYNMETSVQVTGPAEEGPLKEIRAYLDELREEGEGGAIAVGYEKYADPSRGRRWLYRFQEATGLSTF